MEKSGKNLILKEKLYKILKPWPTLKVIDNIKKEVLLGEKKKFESFCILWYEITFK